LVGFFVGFLVFVVVVVGGFVVAVVVSMYVGEGVGGISGEGVGLLVVGLQVNSTQALPSQVVSSGKSAPSSASIQRQPHSTSAVRHWPHVGLLPDKSVQGF